MFKPYYVPCVVKFTKAKYTHPHYSRNTDKHTHTFIIEKKKIHPPKPSVRSNTRGILVLSANVCKFVVWLTKFE